MSGARSLPRPSSPRPAGVCEGPGRSEGRAGPGGPRSRGASRESRTEAGPVAPSPPSFLRRLKMELGLRALRRPGRPSPLPCARPWGGQGPAGPVAPGRRRRVARASSALGPGAREPDGGHRGRGLRGGRRPAGQPGLAAVALAPAPPVPRSPFPGPPGGTVVLGDGGWEAGPGFPDRTAAPAPEPCAWARTGPEGRCHLFPGYFQGRAFGAPSRAADAGSEFGDEPRTRLLLRARGLSLRPGPPPAAAPPPAGRNDTLNLQSFEMSVFSKTWAPITAFFFFFKKDEGGKKILQFYFIYFFFGFSRLACPFRLGRCPSGVPLLPLVTGHESGWCCPVIIVIPVAYSVHTSRRQSL